MEIIEAFAEKKGGRLALPLERLRYQVLNVIRYAVAIRFGGDFNSRFYLLLKTKLHPSQNQHHPEKAAIWL